MEAAYKQGTEEMIGSGHRSPIGTGKLQAAGVSRTRRCEANAAGRDGIPGLIQQPLKVRTESAVVMTRYVPPTPGFHLGQERESDVSHTYEVRCDTEVMTTYDP